MTGAPGVGPLTAIAFAAAIEAPFPNRRASGAGASLGRVPKRYQPGEVDIGGRISKGGDRLARSLLFEAASGAAADLAALFNERDPAVGWMIIR